MRRFLMLTVLATTLMAPRAIAQHIRVAVVFNDSAAQGRFQSGFSAAIRALGDIDVVSTSEEPDYVLAGTVICDPQSCDQALSYVLAVRLYRPMTRVDAVAVVSMLPLAPTGLQPGPWTDSAATVVQNTMAAYEIVYSMWVLQWGRNRYEEATHALVAQIDAQCFDKRRAFLRAQQANTPTAWNTYVTLSSAKAWLC